MVLGTRALVVSLASMFAVTLYSISELGSLVQGPLEEIHGVQRHRKTETHTPREVLHHQSSPLPSSLDYHGPSMTMHSGDNFLLVHLDMQAWTCKLVHLHAFGHASASTRSRCGHG